MTINLTRIDENLIHPLQLCAQLSLDGEQDPEAREQDGVAPEVLLAAEEPPQVGVERLREMVHNNNIVIRTLQQKCH